MTLSVCGRCRAVGQLSSIFNIPISQWNVDVAITVKLCCETCDYKMCVDCVD